MNLSTISLHSRGLKRPYWLLLVLALFLGGQIASAGHWHDSAKTIDHDCALCVLSSATSGAITSNVWHAVVFLSFIFIAFHCVAPLTRGAERFYESRAPPVHS